MTKNSSPPMDEKHLRIIERAAIAPVRLEPLTYNNAISLRMRLYRLRKRLLLLPTHSHHQYAKLISISMRPNTKGDFLLEIGPKDLGLEEAYTKAGIIAPEDDPPPLD